MIGIGDQAPPPIAALRGMAVVHRQLMPLRDCRLAPADRALVDTLIGRRLARLEHHVEGLGLTERKASRIFEESHSRRHSNRPVAMRSNPYLTAPVLPRPRCPAGRRP